MRQSTMGLLPRARAGQLVPTRSRTTAGQKNPEHSLVEQMFQSGRRMLENESDLVEIRHAMPKASSPVATMGYLKKLPIS